MKKQSVNLLECTLRDGSYAIDFKFTERDTALIAGLLSKLGFKWIEVGHGLGIHASLSGKGGMPASDEDIIRAAKQNSGDSLIGAFCIPGIATLESMKTAKEAGLDFVRIGYNATDVEKAFPFIEEARKLGLIPCLNFMKSYAITPKVFAEKSAAAVKAGCEIIYCVDSAGSMFPEDVRAYFSALRDKCGCKSGFHAHNNLQLAVANAIEAYKCGATFIDTTLYGIGRSSGNVPTEVAIAVFDRMGVETGADLFDVMDTAEAYMEPLMSRIQMYDMLGVVMGYSQFHSSFLPKVEASARKHNVDIKRLIAEMGKINPVDLEEDRLDAAASALAKKSGDSRKDHLISFAVPGMTRDSVHSTLESVETLLNGMVVTATKKRAITVLELVPAVNYSEDLVLADFMLSSEDIVLGKVTFGSAETLRNVLDLAAGKVNLFLFNRDGGNWDPEIYEKIKSTAAGRLLLPFSFKKAMEEYLENLLFTLKYTKNGNDLLIYGNCTSNLIDYLCGIFGKVNIYGKISGTPAAARNCFSHDSIDNLKKSGKMDLILCLSTLAAEDAAAITGMLAPSGAVITLGDSARLQAIEAAGKDRLISIDTSDAYYGFIKRNMAIAAAISKNTVRAEEI